MRRVRSGWAVVAIVLVVATWGCKLRKERGGEGASCTDAEACYETLPCLRGKCVAPEIGKIDGTCRTGTTCRTEGKCAGAVTGVEIFGPRHYGCLPETDAHCAASEGCAVDGNCGLVGEEAQRRCEPTAPAHCSA